VPLRQSATRIKVGPGLLPTRARTKTTDRFQSEKAEFFHENSIQDLWIELQREAVLSLLRRPVWIRINRRRTNDPMNPLIHGGRRKAQVQVAHLAQHPPQHLFLHRFVFGGHSVRFERLSHKTGHTLQMRPHRGTNTRSGHDRMPRRRLNPIRRPSHTGLVSFVIFPQSLLRTNFLRRRCRIHHTDLFRADGALPFSLPHGCLTAGPNQRSPRREVEEI